MDVPSSFIINDIRKPDDFRKTFRKVRNYSSKKMLL